MQEPYIIKIKDKSLQLGEKTILMGVLNVTPDSFSDGGNFLMPEKAIEHGRQMIEEGATIIDIGGESTRPGAEQVSSSVEKKRIIPVIVGLAASYSKVLLSIDTYKSEVAKAAIEAGADIINDVSGLQLDPLMPSVAASLRVPIIINHMRGTPRTMQVGEITYTDVIQDILSFFRKQIKLLKKHGFAQEHILLDPGFGFGKTVEQNIEIISRLEEFTVLGLPLAIGLSRKSTIGKILQTVFETKDPFPPGERLEASLAATAVAVLHGASIIRTHDVLQTRRFLSVIDTLKYPTV